MKVSGEPPTEAEWRELGLEPVEPERIEQMFEAIVTTAHKHVTSFAWGARWPDDPVREREPIPVHAMAWELLAERGRPRQVRRVGCCAEYTLSEMAARWAADADGYTFEVPTGSHVLALDDGTLRAAVSSVQRFLDEIVHDDPGQMTDWYQEPPVRIPLPVPVSAVEISPPAWVRDRDADGNQIAQTRVRIFVAASIAPHPDNPHLKGKL